MRALVFIFLLGVAGCAMPNRAADASRREEWFNQRADGLILRETWHDRESGGGLFFFADPRVQTLSALHTNQTALGGGSAFVSGSLAILVDSNLVPAVAATGTAAGNIAGAAAKSALH